MKKRLYVPMLFYLTIIVIFFVIVWMNAKEDIKIHLYDAHITLDPYGDMHVVETFNMTYQGDYNVRFRDIRFLKYPAGYPFTVQHSNMASFDTSSASIKVYQHGVDITDQVILGYSFLFDKDELGDYIDCPDGRFFCESLFTDFTPVGGLKGEITFVYEYKILGAVTAYSDISELNWKLFDYMEATIEKVDIEINLPDNLHEKSAISLYTHGGIFQQGDILSNQKIKIEANHIKPKSFVEFRILMPNDLFNQLALEHHVLADDLNLASLQAYEDNLLHHYAQGEKLIQIPTYGIYVVIFMMIGATLFVYITYDKEHNVEGNSLLELDDNSDTPAEVGYLYRMQKVTDEDVTATLLDLIRKNVIAIDFYMANFVSGDANFTLTRKKDIHIPLKAHEEHLLTWFFDVMGDGNQVKTKDIELFAKSHIDQARAFEGYARRFMAKVKEEVSKRKYFEIYSKKERAQMRLPLIIPAIYGLVSVIIGEIYDYPYWMYVVFSIVLFLSYLGYTKRIKRRTIEGQKEYIKWDRFKESISDNKRLKKSAIPSIFEWEQYLVYATTFGLADKVMEQFNVMMPEDDKEPSTDMAYTRRLFRNNIHRQMNHTYRHARNQASQTISVHRSSSSSRGGSSFGGGGGGGRSR